MSTLSRELDTYITIRRSLGYDLRTSERVLRRFVDFAEAEGDSYVSLALFTKWQKSFGSAQNHTWAARLGMIRLFAQWLHGIDERHELLPSNIIPTKLRRSRPYIYSFDEITKIIIKAQELQSINGLRPLTYSILFGLIAVTGLRISEALALDANDVDLVAGIITVRHGKSGKERLIPLERTTCEHLAVYANERERLLCRKVKPFFVSDEGKRLTDCAARYNFALVCQAVGLRKPQSFHKHGCGPRIHDLRHSFAVNTMLGWYHSGKDPNREMIKLTTYLGHSQPSNTYWYIEAVPELLELASRRAENLVEEGGVSC